jgi:hypothetical protein
MDEPGKPLVFKETMRFGVEIPGIEADLFYAQFPGKDARSLYQCCACSLAS